MIAVAVGFPINLFFFFFSSQISQSRLESRCVVRTMSREEHSQEEYLGNIRRRKAEEHKRPHQHATQPLLANAFGRNDEKGSVHFFESIVEPELPDPRRAAGSRENERSVADGVIDSLQYTSRNAKYGPVHTMGTGIYTHRTSPKSIPFLSSYLPCEEWIAHDWSSSARKSYIAQRGDGRASVWFANLIRAIFVVYPRRG